MYYENSNKNMLFYHLWPKISETRYISGLSINRQVWIERIKEKLLHESFKILWKHNIVFMQKILLLFALIYTWNLYKFLTKILHKSYLLVNTNFPMWMEHEHLMEHCNTIILFRSTCCFKNTLLKFSNRTIWKVGLIIWCLWYRNCLCIEFSKKNMKENQGTENK